MGSLSLLLSLLLVPLSLLLLLPVGL